MTMIAFATYGDRAEIITDSTSYRQNGTGLGRASKVLTIPHLDAAVTGQGDGGFGVDAKSAVLQVANQVATFDDMIAELPRHLRALWATRRKEWPDASEAIVFVLGYSPRSGRFEAWMFATEQRDLEPIRVSAPWVFPCPWSLKPSLLEVKRIRGYSRNAAERHGVPDKGHLLAQQWMTKPQMVAPGNVGEWVTLAAKVREERALEGWADVYVAGDVFHTRLSRGEVTTRKIHTYNDEGPEFLKMISGTQHPVAQLMDCWCGSGIPSIDCHLLDQLDRRCGCRTSGKTFRECCAVTDDQRAAVSSA